MKLKAVSSSGELLGSNEQTESTLFSLILFRWRVAVWVLCQEFITYTAK